MSNMSEANKQKVRAAEIGELLSGVGLMERLEYEEFHKKKVFLLRSFLKLFDLELKDYNFPDQFEIFEHKLIKPARKDDDIFWPYLVHFRSRDDGRLAMWIILGLRKQNELFVFARSEPYRQTLDINRNDLIWVME